ncbi:MAG: S-layer homology domain-containing protein [Oscillospiraceae bacterium]|nr:S-layer homology domain-containing protein [Oscillospiraceae bacterium]
MKRKLRWLSVILTLTVLLGTMTLGALAAEESVLTLDKATLELTKGQYGYLQLTVKDDKAITDVTIATTDKNVATATFNDVGNSITVAAKGGGETTLTIEGIVDGAPCSIACVVKVSSPVTSVQISEADQILNKDKSFTFHAVWAPNDATDITAVWSSSDPKVATIDSASGKVTGVAPGRTEISVTIGGVPASVKKMVYVSGLTLEPPKNSILVGKAASIGYGIYGEAEDHLAEWTSSNPTVAGVSNGTVYAYNPGTTTITLKAGHYSESCEVTVVEDVASAIPWDLAAGEMLEFSDILSALNDRAVEKAKADLAYISALSANPKEGVIYFGYRTPESPGMGVGNIDSFYKTPNTTQMGIKDLTFVPDKSFGGVTTITYVGYGTNGVPFSGRIRVTVENSGDVIYGAESGKPVFFSAEDFTTACRIKTGQSLRYVTFRLPAKAQGILYQSYNTAGQYMPPVTSDTKYYVYGSGLSIDEIVFVPAKDFTGTVDIPYTATDSSGNSYTGNICITVNQSSSDEGSWVESAVNYTTTGGKVMFAGEDFEQACLKANGQKLKYLSFTLPSEGEGKLYANYVSEAKPGTAITANMQNTVSDLSKISFVPKSGFAGTVKIPFTGLDVTDKKFSGTITIRVLSQDVQVNYTTASLPVSFDPEDFRFSCVSALPKKLAGVEFVELPSAYEGRLLVNYKGFGSGTVVERGTRYYYSGTPGIKQISFIPAADYQGVVELPYIAYDSDGNSVSGVVLIQVSQGYTELKFKDLAGYSRAIPAIEYLKRQGVIGGYSDGTFRPTAFTSRAAYAAMVCRLFNFKALVKDDPYPDVSKNSWCAETAAAAKMYGVIYGDKNGNFNPTASVTKQQAVVMLQRAMESAGKEVPTASAAILRNYNDSASISNYARAAMANMVALGVVEADYYGNLCPDKPITRVEMAMILYRLAVL